MPFSERDGEGQQVVCSTFYGVVLDNQDPFLGHNLDRLEKRFRERYYASVEKQCKREKEGKKPHQTTFKSIENNERRFLMAKIFRHLLLEEELCLEL